MCSFLGFSPAVISDCLPMGHHQAAWRVPKIADVFSTIRPEDPIIVGRVSQNEYTIKSSAYLAKLLLMSWVDAEPDVRSLMYSRDEVRPVIPQYFSTLFKTAA
jgi:hypothetical protein